MLNQLIYPLVQVWIFLFHDRIQKCYTNWLLNLLKFILFQIINTTITLIPTAQYYPLRFHCVQMLIDISQNTGLFIPSLPYILEVLSTYNFDKKHTTVSMKPISLICLLRMSKSQMQENGFKNSVIENVYRLILENAAKDSSYVFFPELYTPCIMRVNILQTKFCFAKCKFNLNWIFNILFNFVSAKRVFEDQSCRCVWKTDEATVDENRGEQQVHWQRTRKSSYGFEKPSRN